MPKSTNQEKNMADQNKHNIVTIPPNVYPGMTFTVTVAGQRVRVNCPESTVPGMLLRITVPVQRDEPEAAPKDQIFEVAVPAGVQPGQPFYVFAGGQRVIFHCPPIAVPGQRIRFRVPILENFHRYCNFGGNLDYVFKPDKVVWTRAIRLIDMKFQWVRMNEGGTVELNAMEHFDFLKSAFVCKIHFLESNDARMRTGYVELVPASEAVVDSRLVIQNRTLVSYTDIANVKFESLPEKHAWFRNICEQLTSSWKDNDHIKICVRWSLLLIDSVEAIMGLSREDMRKRWRIEFLGEPAIAGGPTREWFKLVTEQIYDPACGLWIPSINNQSCVDINPASGESAKNFLFLSIGVPSLVSCVPIARIGNVGASKLF
jgi:hypothetical protein